MGFEGNGCTGEVRLEPGKEARQDFKLKTIGDFTMQLSGAEMVARFAIRTLPAIGG